MYSQRYQIETRRKLQFKRRDGWMIPNIRIGHYIAVNNFLKKQKGIGRPWGLIRK